MDGKPRDVKRVEAGRNGWENVYVGDEGSTLVHARHMLPAGWVDDPHAGTVVTGGSRYSKQDDASRIVSRETGSLTAHGEYGPGELLTMGDGSRWFHPYSGKAPIRL